MIHSHNDELTINRLGQDKEALESEKIRGFNLMPVLGSP